VRLFSSTTALTNLPISTVLAAQVAAMDHVLTIDNSTAHLAGALGLPVSLMLPSPLTGGGSRTAKTAPGIPQCAYFASLTRQLASVLQSVRNTLERSLNGRSPAEETLKLHR